MSKLDLLVKEAVKRGFALVDECVGKKDKCTLDDIVAYQFITTSASVLPKNGSLRWAIEMMEEIPEIFTYPLGTIGPMDTIQEIVTAVVQDLVLEAATKDVEEYARKAGFVSEDEVEDDERHEARAFGR